MVDQMMAAPKIQDDWNPSFEAPLHDCWDGHES
jgi:hypothetical protein